MEKITINIDGMHCGMCETFINDTIRNRFNPKKVKSSFKKNQTVILTEDSIPVEELKDLINNTGYQVISVNSEPYKRKGLFGFE